MFYKNLIINTNFNNLTKNYIKNNKIPHAILLYGNQGTGKEGHSIELAAKLNCKSMINFEACGKCHSCIQLKSMQHPNIHFIIPYPKRNTISKNDHPDKTLNKKDIDDLINIKKNKISDPYSKFKLNNANTILINSIRLLKKDIYNTAMEDGWKIILIFEADKLCQPNTESANALLKILEEPPNKTLFILVTNKYENIISTIKSRCQNIFFPQLSFQKIKNNILNEISQQDLKLLVKIFKGDFRLVKNNINSIQELDEKIIQLLKYIFYTNSSKHTLNNKNNSFLVSLEKSSWNEYMKLLIIIFRDLLLFSNHTKDENLILNNYYDKYNKIIQKYSNANFGKCINAIEKTNNYVNQNGYFPLLMSSLNIEIKRYLNNQKQSTILN